MQIGSLRRFVILAESGSLYRASKRSDISPQAYSKLIASLEREVGAQLVERGARGIRLTPAGEIFLGYAMRTIGELRDTVKLIEDTLEPSSTDSHTITMYHTHWSMEIISLYDYLAEGLGRLELRECSFDSMIKRLEHPKPDCAFGGEVFSEKGIAQLGKKGIVFEPFYETVIGIAVRKDSPLARQKALDKNALANVPLAHYSHREWNKKISDMFNGGVEPQIKFESTADNMLLQYVKDDITHGILTDSLKFHGLQRSGRYSMENLTFIPLSNKDAIFGGGILFSKKYPPSLRVQSMYDKFRNYAMTKIPEYYEAFPMLKQAHLH